MTPSIHKNPFRKDRPIWDDPAYHVFNSPDITTFHQSVPGYCATPLHSIDNLARRLGLGRLLVKDESSRFGIKAFKALGASYAIYRFLKQEWERSFGVKFEFHYLYDSQELARLPKNTFCTATDGNHGRAVAWFARLTNQNAVIFVPKGTVRPRIDGITSESARVIVVNGDYDAAVYEAASASAQNGWIVIQDTATDNYTEIPAWIQAGYLTMFREISQQTGNITIDAVLIQSGVGSLAASTSWYFLHEYSGTRPKLINVEPLRAACLLESAISPSGNLTPATGDLRSIMAGLNCGTPSYIAWPMIRDAFDLFLAIPDDLAIAAMRLFFHPGKRDSVVRSGESGAAGLAGLLALLENSDTRTTLGLDGNSTVLLLNTEGDTDPDHFKVVVGD